MACGVRRNNPGPGTSRLAVPVSGFEKKNPLDLVRVLNLHLFTELLSQVDGRHVFGHGHKGILLRLLGFI